MRLPTGRPFGLPETPGGNCDLSERSIDVPRCLRLRYTQMLADHLERKALYTQIERLRPPLSRTN